MKEKVIKHSGIVHVHHKISLMGQQIFNVLLAYAWRDLKTARTHKIAVKDILRYVPSAGNVTHLRKVLKEMCAPVELNIFGKDNKADWGFFALLPYAKIPAGSGICEYSFMDTLIELLANPRMYAKISLLIQRRYSGNKYGWFLYELCFDYKNVGKTPKISIDQLKHYFGIKKTQYKQFKIFKQDVINAALKGINKQTDLNVKAETFRTGRRITHIQFQIKLKQGFKCPAPLSLEELPNALKQLQEPRKTRKKSPAKSSLKVPNAALIKELKLIGVSAGAVKDILKDYSPPEIKEAIQACKEAAERPKGVHSPTGFVKEALRDGYQSEKTRKLEKEKKFKKAHEAEKAEERRQAEQMRKEEEKYANSDNEEKFEYVLENLSGFKEAYDALNSESRDMLRESAYYIFKNFDNYQSTYKYIQREL